MIQPSATLQRLFHLLKTVLFSTLVLGMVGLLVSLFWRPQPTAMYHSQAVISLTKVRQQKIGTVKYVRYSNGSELTQLFSDNFYTAKANTALRNGLRQAQVPVSLAQGPNGIQLNPLRDSGVIQVNVTSSDPAVAIKAANVAAKVAVAQFEKQYQLKNSRIVAAASRADRQIMTMSRSELMMKFMFAGILLGFLWVFVRELWRHHVTSR